MAHDELASLAANVAAAESVAAFYHAVENAAFPLDVQGPDGSLGAFMLAHAHQAAPLLVVTPTERDAETLSGDLDALGTRSAVFPWWGAIPYRDMAPLSAVFAERARVLAELAGNWSLVSPSLCDPRVSFAHGADPAVLVASQLQPQGDRIASQLQPQSDKFHIPHCIITSQRAFLSPLPPPDYVRDLLATLRVGDTLDTVALAEKLTAWGWTRVQRVQVAGEFVLRGEVLDVFAGDDDDGSPLAHRILFDYDVIESIKRFNPETQSTVTAPDGVPTSSITLCPRKEVIWDDERIEALHNNLLTFEEYTDAAIAPLIESLVTQGSVPGEEQLFALSFSQSATLLEYVGTGAITVFMARERLDNAEEALSREYHCLYEQAAKTKCAPLPERILLPFAEMAAKCERVINFRMFAGGGEYSSCVSPSLSDPRVSFAHGADPAVLVTTTVASQLQPQGDMPPPSAHYIKILCDAPRDFGGNINFMKEEIARLAAESWHIVVTTLSATQAARLESILQSDTEHSGILSVIVAPLSAGFALPEVRLLVVQEREIFGRHKKQPRSLRNVHSSAIDSFVELNPGDYVVHVNYGIGRFEGIERIKALGFERDYIKLEYAGEEFVFVPIEQVNLVQRYIGNEGAPPRLDKLGGRGWSERKERARRAAEELAQRLIGLYSRRKASRGFAFPADSEWQTTFEAAFPWEETDDQLRCVEEIKRDMEAPLPMDRLVCGDVGYGKTEVAIRACFKAVMGGKQVAFLAPTTILVEQHYENFIERFADFPVRIGMLSRFVDRRAIKKTLALAASGGIDILVGTHRIIQKDVVFKDLGLLVIDEEQRFGVKDKERLKEMKHNVDCLALSATPIPRTLHMSLLKIRDMSLLTTAPHNRHPIETSVCEYNESSLVRALRRESERGGQVFYLHNRIATLDAVRAQIERLCPELLVETAHGKMEANELEDIMHRFIHGGFHILVSTTIIENGIDIPNVNTIIIDHADMYGVSQLYQLRGRVGRSDRVAYAYLFYERDKALSEDAMKRLQAISDFTELGSGFKIAMKDMEIRGAGNLLGREQSGNILSVGFDMYLKLLDEAVRRLEDEHFETEAEPLLELEYSGFIPDTYIKSAQIKMEVYKKIAAIRERDEVEEVRAELADRFGPLPDEVAGLLYLAEIRALCRALAISSLKEKKGVVSIEFAHVAAVNVDALVRLMSESKGAVKIDPRRPNVITLQTGTVGLREKSAFIREKLGALS